MLVDMWTRLHRLGTTTIVGREPDGGLAVRESSVSRKHATLTYDIDDDCWYVTDLVSTNGTHVASETEREATDVRGFVRSIELITNLPWNTAHPEDNHVKQQVRRLRRAFERIGLPDLIESRQGFGYRLRVRPVIER